MKACFQWVVDLVERARRATPSQLEIFVETSEQRSSLTLSVATAGLMSGLKATCAATVKSGSRGRRRVKSKCSQFAVSCL